LRLERVVTGSLSHPAWRPAFSSHLISTVVIIYNSTAYDLSGLVAFFAGVTSVITTVLIPVAYFGDKNSRWAKRLAIIAFIAAVILMVAIFYGV
jgi:hypothetical protein